MRIEVATYSELVVLLERGNLRMFFLARRMSSCAPPNTKLLDAL